MEKELELPPITNRKKEDYTSMEKYVLSKLEIAEKTIQDLVNENELLNKKVNTEKHRLTVQQLTQLKKQFLEHTKTLDDEYFKEHNEYRMHVDILEEFVNWLELGGFEVYVK